MATCKSRFHAPTWQRGNGHGLRRPLRRRRPRGLGALWRWGAVPAAGVVAEQMVAIVVAQEIQRMFGGDTVGDLVGAVEAYRARLGAF